MFSQQSLSDGNPTYASRYKVVSDPVHKHITLDDAVLSIIDTPEFQRLRDLKQLGTAYFVFPGAAHNRFEHSIGVSHVSGQLIDFLAVQQPELEITAEERELVRVAGLVHDLGHGPFSHVFDGQFIPTVRKDRSGWSHEEMSLQLFDTLLDDNGLDLFDYDGRKLVKQMVWGGKSKPIPPHILDPPDVQAAYASGALSGGGGAAGLGAGILTWAAALEGSGEDGLGVSPTSPLAPRTGVLSQRPGRDFMYQIVANGSTGIDTDKWDYLARDTHNLGLASSFNHSRLLYSARVLDGQLAYHAKEALAVYEMFHTRYMMFKQIYVHRATKSIEYMLCDIMLEADAAWGRRLSLSIDNPRDYALLTDCILKDIECSKDPALARARSILHDLRRRKLYKFVDEFLLPVDLAKALPKVDGKQLLGYNSNPSVTLAEDTVVVHDLKLDYGKGVADPVEGCLFYRDPRDTRAFHMQRDKISHILPQVFQERVLRVYSRSSDPAVVAEIQQCFRKFLRAHRSSIPMEPAPTSKVPAVAEEAALAGYGLAEGDMLGGNSGSGGGGGGFGGLPVLPSASAPRGLGLSDPPARGDSVVPSQVGAGNADEDEDEDDVPMSQLRAVKSIGAAPAAARNGGGGAGTAPSSQGGAGLGRTSSLVNPRVLGSTVPMFAVHGVSGPSAAASPARGARRGHASTAGTSSQATPSRAGSLVLAGSAAAVNTSVSSAATVTSAGGSDVVEVAAESSAKAALPAAPAAGSAAAATAGAGAAAPKPKTQGTLTNFFAAAAPRAEGAADAGGVATVPPAKKPRLG